MSQQSVTRDGTKIAYRVDGDGAVNVVFVHGWMMNGAVFDHLRPHLNAADHRHILIDMRGGGNSDKPDSGYDGNSLVDDVIAVADDAGAKSFLLIGHSMGGMVAQAVAAKVPDRVEGMALLAPVPLTGMDGVPLPEEAAMAMRGCGGKREQISGVLDQTIVAISDDHKEHLVNLAMQSSVACVEQTFDTFGGGIDGDLYASIKAPTIVVAGDDPVLVPDFLKERVVSRIPGAKMHKVDGAGHYALNEKPAQTAAAINGFFRSL